MHLATGLASAIFCDALANSINLHKEGRCVNIGDGIEECKESDWHTHYAPLTQGGGRQHVSQDLQDFSLLIFLCVVPFGNEGLGHWSVLVSGLVDFECAQTAARKPKAHLPHQCRPLLRV